ncbi:MAG: FliM/FliN family flagellar motor switch protein [Gammaproteobacteria bacterium]
MLIRVGPRPRFRATLEQQRIILQQREATMENPADTQEALTQLDELPVTVTFDLGETTLALREVKGLQPGYAFALAQGMDKPVTLRANGRAIGAGQLIQVGEQLGVRVVELFVRGHD